MVQILIAIGLALITLGCYDLLHSCVINSSILESLVTLVFTFSGFGSIAAFWLAVSQK